MEKKELVLIKTRPLSHGLVMNPALRETERKELDEQMAVFLASGGKIQDCDNIKKEEPKKQPLRKAKPPTLKQKALAAASSTFQLREVCFLYRLGDKFSSYGVKRKTKENEVFVGMFENLSQIKKLRFK